MKTSEFPALKLPTWRHHVATLIIVIAFIETLVHFFLPLLVSDANKALQGAADAFLLIVISAPFTWIFIARPMRAVALSEFARKKATVDHIVEAVINFDVKGRIESLNPAAEAMFGYQGGEILGEKIGHIISGIDGCYEGWRGACPADQVEGGARAEARRKDGTPFPVEISISTVQLEGRETFIAIIHDITKRLQVQAFMEDQKKFVEHLVQNSAVPTFVVSAEHRVLFWNRACEELTGIEAQQMLGESEPWRAFYQERHPVLADLVIDGIRQDIHVTYSGLRDSGVVPEGLQAEGWYRNLGGRDRFLVLNAAPIRNGRGELLAVMETLQDITERKVYEEQLEYQSTHDALTGLPNRNLLADRIRQSMLIARRYHKEAALFFVGLDHFKYINDSLGHDVGDLLLKSVAQRLAGCLRSGDTVARQGGDEFVIVVADLESAHHAGQIAAKINEAVAVPVQINEHELMITCSIGISVFPRDGEDVQTLMKNADLAMYRAKETRNAFQFFTGEMNARTLTRLTMEKHLRRALEREELLLYYQPKVSLRNGLVVGMEALVRWQHPEMGMVSPACFIPLAEETGLIEQIGEWVIRTACKQNKAWQEAGLPALPVAVNLSARQFSRNCIAKRIRGILHETGLDPQWLEIEITESLIMEQVERVSAVLDELKRMGVHLTMDDFGTGYSSLSYLKRFPFDKLKVDQSFVRDITSSPDSATIAKAVIAMAKSLHLRVIAEGVETEGQLTYLHSLQCDEIQGFYFSRPVPAEQFGALLREKVQLKLPASHDAAAARQTVLVVDDEAHVTAALQRMLHLDGYRVLTAGSAAEGFEVLASNPVSVVLSDQCMPGMSGSEFLGRVKELYPETVRMVLSAHCDMDSVTSAINSGAIYKYLVKPWNEDHLRAVLADAFSYSAQHTRYSAVGNA